ncbi:cofilin, partial [Kickxella alabastrina]
SSGIPTNDQCLKKFTGLKTRHLYKYVIFQMNEQNNEIIVGHRYRLKKSTELTAEDLEIIEGDDETNTSNLDKEKHTEGNETNTSNSDEEKPTEEEMYEDFLAHLPETECRYAVYDIQFQKKEVLSNKIVFITWSPDNAKIKAKMIYASSKNVLISSLNGVHQIIQATDMDEVSFASIEEKLQRV